jgi:hypothetical protein
VLATMSAVQAVHPSSFAFVAPFELTGTEVTLLPAQYYSVEVECASAQFSPFRHPLASNQLLTYGWFSVLPSLLLLQLHRWVVKPPEEYCAHALQDYHALEQPVEEGAWLVEELRCLYHCRCQGPNRHPKQCCLEGGLMI